MKGVLYNPAPMTNLSDSNSYSQGSTELVEIQRTNDVLSFTLNNPDQGNQVTGTMFDAMLAALRSENSVARVLRVRARGTVFCTGRERTGRDAESVRAEAARLID